jgi:hypothetical protein
LWVENQCNEIDSFTRIVYFAPSPTAVIDTTQRVFCPGYGTVVLDGSQSEYSNTHIWSVSEVIDDSLFDEMTTHVLEEEWEIAGNVSASFNFPGFKFEGGKSYIISLEVNNRCGISEDTFYIHIPLGAKIDFANVTVYHPNIGESSIQLNSIVSGQTSFEWTPHDGLSDPYITNPIAEPNEDIVYVLWASDGVCDDYDTIEVKFNEFANAGDDRTICYGGSTELGYYDNLGLEWIWHPDIEIDNTGISYPIVTPTVNRTYNVIVTKIENNEVIIETDEVNVYVDSILDVTFEKQQQNGWSVRFLNTTLKINPETTFSWDFDSLGTSTERSPWFTFPSVETDYEVCLSITNACDTYTECQTINVDSLGGGFLGKRNVNDNDYPIIKDNPIANDYSSHKNSRFELYPNPSKSFTIAKYAMNQNGSIDVYNSTGKLVKSIILNPNYDESMIDLTGLSAGIYTCKLQVEGMPAKMLKLVKMH